MATKPFAFTADNYQYLLNEMIKDALKDGVVLTIELQPTQPLRMGGYKMVGHAREARVPA